MPLHPFVEQMLAKAVGVPKYSDLSPSGARALLTQGSAALGDAVAMLRVDEFSLPTRSGRIAAHLLVPQEQVCGLVVFLHGGGWVVGSPDDYDVVCRALAAETGCTVLVPDYRLAPEHPFPAALQDCEDVVRHVAKVGLGDIRCRPLILAGDSAGANLATIVAGKLHEEIGFRLQALFYPVVDCDFTTSSYRTHGNSLLLTTADMQWFFNHYAAASEWASPDISPIRKAEHGSSPPAIIVTAEYDVLADEGEAYAKALERDGVRVVHRRIPGVTHGFIRQHNLFAVARDELIKVAAEIRAACDDDAGFRTPNANAPVSDRELGS